MNNAIDRITLDVHKAVSQVSLIWKRGDTARTIEAVLTDNGKPFVLDGCTVSFTAADALPALHYCEIKDNRIIYNAAPIVTQSARSLLCEFRVIGADGKVLTAPRFTIDVRDTVIDPDKVEETEKGSIGTLDKLISDAAEIVEEIETKLANGEFDGKDGKDGKDGVIWHFGTVVLTGFSHISKIPGAKNGDWYLNTNTYDIFVADADYWGYVGNIKGADGKSAYQYAKEAGFSGTEAEFAELLASIGSGGGGTVNLSDYYKKAETYNRTEIDSKVREVEGKIPTKPSDIGAQDKGDYQPAGDYALKSEIPDVPVKSVNNKTGAVQLNADDVGARANTWTPTYTEVGADKNGTAASAVSAHNFAADSHNDIRDRITALNSRLNALANSEDVDLDDFKEIVAYIKANRGLIDGVTTSKVSVDAIADNLTTTTAGKVLSANQGVALKALIDTLSSDKLDKSVFNSRIASYYTATQTEAYVEGYAQPIGNYALVSQLPTKPSDIGAAPSDKTITIMGVDESGTIHTWTVYGV